MKNRPGMRCGCNGGNMDSIFGDGTLFNAQYNPLTGGAGVTFANGAAAVPAAGASGGIFNNPIFWGLVVIAAILYARS